ncbi:MAG TPA: hypothetical protein VGR66_10840 [Candidatus Eisenbacteria bacterium]|nr:hypothetical protein [Candidatus Eisenbacteria bacterium]
MPSSPEPDSAKSNRPAPDVFHTWWPLAASWILMGLEVPAVSAVIARLPHPTVGLAAYGGIVMPVSMFIEGPIIMLLAASTALSRDRASYAVGRRFMLRAGLVLTAVHALVAFSPLYDVVAGNLLHAPPETLEAGRLGLRIMTFWTICIAYRRFQQGVLIRFGHGRSVGVGTLIRLGTNALLLTAGALFGTWPGIAVGTVAVASGVLAEALYAGWRVHPVLARELPARDETREPVTPASFRHFYLPLALTPVFLFAGLPITSAAVGRMPLALDSLAVWPVVNGLAFTVRSLGFAFNEVVVSLLERPGAPAALQRFAWTIAIAGTVVLAAVAMTPLASFYFSQISALPTQLGPLAGRALWILVPLPAITALQSLYQGALVYDRRTRAVTESVLVFLGVSVLLQATGVALQRWTGIYVALLALVAANTAQLTWLWLRGRHAYASLTGIAAPESLPLPGAPTS